MQLSMTRLNNVELFINCYVVVKCHCAKCRTTKNVLHKKLFKLLLGSNIYEGIQINNNDVILLINSCFVSFVVPVVIMSLVIQPEHDGEDPNASMHYAQFLRCVFTTMV